MGKAHTVILGIISFLIIGAIPGIIMGIAAMPLFYPNTYIKILDENSIYDKIPQAIAGGNEEFATLFTKDMIKSNIDRIMINVFSYIRGETQDIDLSIPIDKNQLKGIILQRINEIPQCPAGITPQDSQNPECLPSGVNRAQLVELTFSNIQVPDKIDFIEQQPELKKGLDDIKSMYSLLNIIIYTSIALTIVLFVIVIFITRKSKKTMLKWIGSNLAISGASVLVLSFILKDLVINAVASQAQISPTILAVITSVIGILAYGMLIYSLIILVIGLVLFVLSMKIKENK